MRKYLFGVAMLLSCTNLSSATALKFEPGVFSISGADANTQTASAALPPQTSQVYMPNAAQDDLSGPDRAIIDFQSSLAPGSILVRTKERKLYFILPDHQAIMYRVGVGREGFAWQGTNRISRKAVWPSWHPPTVMIHREAEKGHIIPDFMEGGTANPLGARAMYLGSTDFRIHGTSQPWSIGHAVSSGCIRMLNEHVIDLYNRAAVGAEVVVE